MKTLFDTSVLVAALVTSHPVHLPAADALQEIKEGRDNGLVAMHSIAELYSILTRLPIRPRISAEAANKMIQRDVLAFFEIVSLTPEDYVTIIQQLANRRMTGGIIYDALIMHAAVKAGAEKILTLNKKDFSRIVPQWADRMIEL